MAMKRLSDKEVAVSEETNNDSCLFSLSPEQFTALATFIGFLLASNLNIDQQNSLGSFFQAIGQVIATISAQGSTLQSQKNNKQVSKQLELIKAQIELLERQLEN